MFSGRGVPGADGALPFAHPQLFAVAGKLQAAYRCLKIAQLPNKSAGLDIEKDYTRLLAGNTTGRSKPFAVGREGETGDCSFWNAHFPDTYAGGRIPEDDCPLIVVSFCIGDPVEFGKESRRGGAEAIGRQRGACDSWSMIKSMAANASESARRQRFRASSFCRLQSHHRGQENQQAHRLHDHGPNLWREIAIYYRRFAKRGNAALALWTLLGETQSWPRLAQPRNGEDTRTR